jgi:hypothetical protein
MLYLPSAKCRVGQEVKTPPFHGGITGSSPVRGTKNPALVAGFLFIKLPKAMQYKGVTQRRCHEKLMFVPKKNLFIEIPNQNLPVG